MLKNKDKNWKNYIKKIQYRCNNPKATGYEYYGGKGIKCLLTAEELKKLWFRDKAYLMKKPSLSRLNHDNNYVYENCRFIELSLHSKLDRKPIKRKPFKNVKTGQFIYFKS